MGIMFATDKWAKALMGELNGSDAYRKAAAKWEGDFYFVVEEGPGFPQDTYLYLDLWHGEARDAYLVDDPAAKTPAFELRAPVATWRSLLEKKLDPIGSIVSGKLNLKGSKLAIIKMPKAATELVTSATMIDTDWPS